MTKYRGSNFEDYLKEKGISKEVRHVRKSGGRLYALRCRLYQKILLSPQVIHLNSVTDFFIDSVVALITCFHN